MAYLSSIKKIKKIIRLKKDLAYYADRNYLLSREGIEPPSASYRPILLQRTTITIRSSALFLL